MTTLLNISDLHVRFRTREGAVQAVDGVSFTVRKGEILGIVGESGCGKSVTARAIMRLIGDAKNEEVSGRIELEGEDLLRKSEKEMTRLRGRKMAMIFQDPMTSLNPVFPVGAQIAEGPRWHERLSTRAARRRAVEMLASVGIPAPEDRAGQYPHEFSGGMRQRAVIATALSCSPDLLIADEPTTALDVTIQAQILDLLRELRDRTGAGMIFITHDLGVVAELCDRVAVMYAGSIIEEASVSELFRSPHHPYTKGLLNSLPVLGRKDRIKPIEGRPPDLSRLPVGCRFADRCPFVFDKCAQLPPLKELGRGHRSACWLEGET
jgi:oligopeptide transport system ATP-binding protein